MLSSPADIAEGAVVESAIAFFIGALLYRALAGRFLVPKRETVLPYHRAVLIKKDGQTKAVESGRRWVFPGEKLITCDARPRTLQIESYHALSADAVVMLLCISGEYRLTDPVRYLAVSTNAAEKLHAEVRRKLSTLCRQWSSTAAMGVGVKELISNGVIEAMRGSSDETGMELTSFQVWDLVLQGVSGVQSVADDDLLQ